MILQAAVEVFSQIVRLQWRQPADKNGGGGGGSGGGTSGQIIGSLSVPKVLGRS